MTTKPHPPHELRMTRAFSCSAAELYRAFTEPLALTKWFGPAGMSVPLDSIDQDVRIGGHQKLTMVSADGQHRAPLDITFTEVVPERLLCGQETWGDPTQSPPPSLITMRREFAATDSGARLDLRQGPLSSDVVSMTRQGWLSSFTKLDVLLAANSTDQ